MVNFNLTRRPAETNPTLDLTQTLTLTLWGARGRRGLRDPPACFGGVFLKKTDRRKVILAQQDKRPAQQSSVQTRPAHNRASRLTHPPRNPGYDFGSVDLT